MRLIYDKRRLQTNSCLLPKHEWSRYLVWDQDQANFVRRCVGNQAETEIIGPTWSSESTAIIPDLSSRTVGVFDIQRKRKSIYEALGTPSEYYTPAIGVKILKDIHEVVSQKCWVMAWKGKIKLPQGRIRQLAKSYESTCRQIAASSNVLPIDLNIVAARLIEKCAMVISMPFTSIALIAKNLGLPSYYYDPSGLIQREDRAAHGIPVISGVDELQEILAMESAKCNTVPQGSCLAAVETACGKC